MKLLTFEEASKQGVVDWHDMSTMKQITCRNHPTARYLSKNPSMRGLHFISRPVEAREHPDWPNGECPCPLDDLRVVVDEEV